MAGKKPAKMGHKKKGGDATKALRGRFVVEGGPTNHRLVDTTGEVETVQGLSLWEAINRREELNG